MQDKKPDAPVSKDSNLVTVTTPEYVDDSIKEAIAQHAASRNHPYATQIEPGFVTLSNETDSDSELTVATSKAVKKAYDLANTANQNVLNNSVLYLEKKQNGADILDKDEFVKNIGLAETIILAKNAVPNNRKINDKPLTNDIILNSKDVGAVNSTKEFGYIPSAEYLGVFSVSEKDIINRYVKGINFGWSDYDTGQIYLNSSGDLYAYYLINGGEGYKDGKQIGGKVWSEVNTSTDNNGCIKTFSPTILIYSDGKYTTNKLSKNVTVERLSKGSYLIKGVSGFNTDRAADNIEIPKCHNNLPLIWINYEVLLDGSIKLMTHHREHSDAPAFARNIREGYANGDLIDIPDGRFVSVRVQMPDIQESQS
ncbi:tail protein [Xenorhabdus mauleonii]|uniref:Phage tail fibre repeat-containing protein n=1 Tax=Xenorhabdus mauleonii TaxID=351675 RepID=A0A1I3MW75_9GAMM|nr:phage tail protein [Xenorhabdus mauleonii]PHM45858.1 tail protein [Xenorhabdus mauleonii]SFJ01374.1 Phage tail fibre repeat-containing protein [Xenorhabdus mauleonii]